ncbi:DUF3383 domain-containing protein [Pantoea brenneri]|uniref:DUF3383 family protein n=1 Tax=Pantoea brenneri TaxID=472694 RepID=UPI002449324A|nr:DUF3383 family protein [Pantoea brenneri]MDH1085300.1 DUF3383 domain-containing protein [Pantoea brenneri]
MSASINNVINVTLLEEGRAAARDNINVCAIMTSQSGVLSTAERWRSYKSPSAVEQDWGASSDTAAFANAFFSTSPNPVAAGGTLIIGYWNAAGDTLPATAGYLRGSEISQASVLPALRQHADWSFAIKVDGVNHEITGIDGTTAATMEDVVQQIQAKITPQVASVEFDGYRIVITSKTTGDTSTVGEPTRAAAGGTYITGLIGIASGSGAVEVKGKAEVQVDPETQLEALSALKAVVNIKGVSFIDKILDAQVPLIAIWAKANAVIVYETFTGSETLEVNPANPAWAVTLASQTNFRTLFSKSNNRKMGVSYMARTHTVNFNGERTAITMHLKTLSVPAEEYSQTEIDKAKRVGLDIYTTIKDVPCVLSSGSNDFVDNVYNLMAYVDAVQTDSFNLLKTTPTKVAQTYYGVDQLEDCVEKTTRGFVRAGVFSPGTWTLPDFFGDREMFLRNIEQEGFYVLAGDLADQSTADRQERKSPVIQVAVKNAGAIHSADIIINFNK